MSFLLFIAAFAYSLCKSRWQLTLENLALRQQLAMPKQSVKRPRVSPVDRLFWVLFSKYVDGWRAMLHALHPDTVVRWHRQGFRFFIGDGRVEALSRDDQPLMQAFENSSEKCRRTTWAGVYLESMGNC